VNDSNHLLLPPPLRRRLLLGAGSALLTGCASDSLSLIGSTLGVTGPSGHYLLSDEQIAAIPYACLGVRIGNGGGVVMVLASIDGEQLSWASADRVVLVTRAGRLVKTIGLSRDLLTRRDIGPDLLGLASRGDPAAAEARVSRIVDLRPDDDFSVPVDTRCEPMGEETLTLLGTPLRVLKVRERVTVRKWRWATDNVYWLDADSGRVWKSRQQFCPQVAPITMELLKPAAGHL
jgi:hypothetical protein